MNNLLSLVPIVITSYVALQLTSTNKMIYFAFLPLEQVSTFTTADVQSCTAMRTVLQVAPNQDTLHPVIEVAHQLDRTLMSDRLASGNGQEFTVKEGKIHTNGNGRSIRK